MKFRHQYRALQTMCPIIPMTSQRVTKRRVCFILKKDRNFIQVKLLGHNVAEICAFPSRERFENLEVN